YAASGSLFHLTVEKAESEILGTGAIHAPLERALEIFEEVWAEHARFGSPAINDAWMRRARPALIKLYTHWPTTGIPVALEKEVEAEIGGVAWRGIIDRLERDRKSVVEGKSVVVGDRRT